jgi:hypothetical protein
MPRYAIDVSAWIYVTADNRETAFHNASDIISDALPDNFHGGDWEITNIEESEDEKTNA